MNSRHQEYSSLCYISPNGDIIVPEGISLGTKGPLPSLNLQSGIYEIASSDGEDLYIRSTIDHATRLRSHRDLGSSDRWLNTTHRLYSIVRTLSPESFTYSVLQPAKNLLTSFNEVHPGFNLSIKDAQLLEAFTKYELAIVEQSYLDH